MWNSPPHQRRYNLLLHPQLLQYPCRHLPSSPKERPFHSNVCPGNDNASALRRKSISITFWQSIIPNTKACPVSCISTKTGHTFFLSSIKAVSHYAVHRKNSLSYSPFPPHTLLLRAPKTKGGPPNIEKINPNTMFHLPPDPPSDILQHRKSQSPGRSQARVHSDEGRGFSW